MKEGKRLTTVLQEKEWTSRDTLTTVLSFHLKVSVADPRQVEVDPEAVRLVPETMTAEIKALPLSTDRDGTLRVLMEDPGDFDTINKLSTFTGRQIKAVLPIGEGLDELIRRNYSSGADLGGVINVAVEAEAAVTRVETTEDYDSFAAGDGAGLLTSRTIAQAPVAHAVDMITLPAVKIEASDVHLRPGQDSSKVLYRVDGVLHEGPVVRPERAAPPRPAGGNAGADRQVTVPHTNPTETSPALLPHGSGIQGSRAAGWDALRARGIPGQAQRANGVHTTGSRKARLPIVHSARSLLAVCV
jgi:type IV pilus assembly protein PilB